jgi:colanic acid biosynthesis glycosyl transferase WcaI
LFQRSNLYHEKDDVVLREIVLVTQWFPPEQAPIGHMLLELGTGLAARGWNVTVVTGFPNHPKGEVFAGYRKQWVQEENIDGVRILRVWLATSKNRSRANRLLSFLTFTFTSAWAVLRSTNPAIIFAIFQPLSMGVVLPPLARLKRAKLILNVQDLHPDVPIELGLVKNPLLIRILRSIERFGYRAANGLAVISQSFRQHCITIGAHPENVRVIENWIDLDEIQPGSRDTSLRRQLGFAASDIVVLYAGTIGLVSGAEIVIEAAARLQQRTDIKFLFVGGGPLIPNLTAQVQSRNLPNVAFIPFQDRARLAEVQATSDISLVTLAPGKGRTSVPSKVLGYMAAARPVVASVDLDCDTAGTIARAECGIVSPAGDASSLADSILHLAENPQQRITKGNNGRTYAETHLMKTMIVAQYEQMFECSLGLPQ